MAQNCNEFTRFWIKSSVYVFSAWMNLLKYPKRRGSN